MAALVEGEGEEKFFAVFQHLQFPFGRPFFEDVFEENGGAVVDAHAEAGAAVFGGRPEGDEFDADLYAVGICRVAVGAMFALTSVATRFAAERDRDVEAWGGGGERVMHRVEGFAHAEDCPVGADAFYEAEGRGESEGMKVYLVREFGVALLVGQTVAVGGGCDEVGHEVVFGAEAGRDF